MVTLTTTWRRCWRQLQRDVDGGTIYCAASGKQATKLISAAIPFRKIARAVFVVAGVANVIRADEQQEC
jgi:hypothetical protein